ncbi:hypothetical protein SAMN05443287_10721 [Micromonospora phaseoli]|uniref:EcsC protein family protein n=1 Tax=Micromonospora phaseoli TaxID=1144548 RepID=A0A1H7B9E1_9ACTN|nr:hypothetical protein [Micromonospora phaseoli]PZV95200.1 hypothetical protein CLV64_108341 [Micromonospora phaseoli]GIJ79019.1 hypothetical protein Xph01_34510 [Micromonospora phaseoli]SEJ72877.1 hypothetical protein SAMN05443287_10721 [Micromonospora phaseoli]
MQEQPSSEPTRREPAEGARRRSPKATFTPPPTPAPPALEEQDDTAGPRTRRAKAAPNVIFQPPPAAEQPLPRQPRPGAAVPPATPTPPFAVASPTGDATGAVPSTVVPRRGGDGRPDAPGTGTDGSDAAADPVPATRRKVVAKKVTTPRKATRKTAPTAAATAESTAADIAPATATPKKAAPAKAAKKVTKKAAPAVASEVSAHPAPTVPAPPAIGTPPTAPPAIAAPPIAPPTAPDPVTGDGGADASGRTPESELRMLVARVLDHPGFAPELLALTAVEALGPGAAQWARRLRQAYPEADSAGLARLASRRFVRQAGIGGATAALAGVFAPAVELTAVLWSQANLVLHLAAAYDRDPAHPDRAAELLVLTQVHPDRASAVAALAAARAADGPGEQPGPRVAEAAWRLAAPLAAQAGGWLALRLVSRLLPGAAALTAAAGDTMAAQRLAARAIALYRQSQSNHSLGSRL